MLTPPKTKRPFMSPIKCETEKTISNKIESPKKKLDFGNDGKTSTQTCSKRKFSPTKTPENKKFKVDSHQLSDTQVSNHIIMLPLFFL